jgi:hypothetical protein
MAALDPPYECSSDRCYRRFEMLIYPFANGEGLLVDNALRVERPQEQPGHSFATANYVDPNGIVVQCGHCRRVRHKDQPPRWDWCPDAVRDVPERVSHGPVRRLPGLLLSDQPGRLHAARASRARANPRSAVSCVASSPPGR